MLVEDFSEPLLSLRTETNRSFKYETLSLVCPLGENLTFFFSLEIAEFNFPFIFKLPFSRPFWNSLDHASTSNIREVVKVYSSMTKVLDQTIVLIIFHQTWSQNLIHSYFFRSKRNFEYQAKGFLLLLIRCLNVLWDIWYFTYYNQLLLNVCILVGMKLIFFKYFTNWVHKNQLSADVRTLAFCF